MDALHKQVQYVKAIGINAIITNDIVDGALAVQKEE